MARSLNIPCLSMAFACFCLSLGAGLSEEHRRPTYELLRVIDVAGRQGVDTDGKRYFVSGSKPLYIYSKHGKLLKANEDPFAGLEKPANHIGDISVHDGKLYAGMEWFEDGRGRDIQIGVHDAGILEYERSRVGPKISQCVSTASKASVQWAVSIASYPCGSA